MHYRGSSPPLPGAEGDVKNVMIQGALTSFAAVTVSSVGGEKKNWDRGNRSQVLFFPSQTFFMRAIVTVDLCWTGCSRCVDSEFTQLFKGLLVQCVCVCVCTWKCLPAFMDK